MNWTPMHQKKFVAMKSRLTRAQNRRDWRAVLRACDAFEKFFDENGGIYPDNWAHWDIARRNAEFEISRETLRRES